MAEEMRKPEVRQYLHQLPDSKGRRLLLDSLNSRIHPCASLQLQVADYFARLVQRVAPKHYAQAMAEVTVTRLFLENFSGDQVIVQCSGVLCQAGFERQRELVAS